ncbi:unnamed protein product [Rhizophagus irregularis]|nr:unnamed protein product [Rhizophagus irregularis]
MFLNHMVELKRVGTRDPFAKLTKIFTYNARQLCHYWRNYLDPEVCQHNLYDYEKQYIDNWIRSIEQKMVQFVGKPASRFKKSIWSLPI